MRLRLVLTSVWVITLLSPIILSSAESLFDFGDIKISCADITEENQSEEGETNAETDEASVTFHYYNLLTECPSYQFNIRRTSVCYSFDNIGDIPTPPPEIAA